MRLPAHYAGPSGRGRKESMAAWAARGITRIDGAHLGEGTAALLLPAGADGPAFLVTRNFDAIYSYNAAESYALAISLLADRLKGLPVLRTAWPTNDPGLSRAQRREVQALLIRRGYDLDGKMDGVIGTKTRAAIIDFQTKAGLSPHGAGQCFRPLRLAGALNPSHLPGAGLRSGRYVQEPRLSRVAGRDDISPSNEFGKALAG